MILVTGGTGLVGSHLLYRLTTENEKVRAIYRTKKSIEKTKKVFSFYTSEVDKFFSKIEWFQADITDVPQLILAFKGITHVYHCAALVSFNPKDYREMRKVNIHGTAIIVNLSVDVNVKKLCFVSSIAAVGDAINRNIITEENEWNDQADNHSYAITKFGAEMEVWRASQEGVDVVIVNPGVILGSGFWNSGSGKMFTQVANGFKFYTEGITAFVGVQDVVKAMVALLNSDVKNERFILVSENKSFKDIFFFIADRLKKKRPSKSIKPWQTQLFWRLDWILTKLTGKEPLFTKNLAKSAHNVSYYSSEKIKKTINFKFEKIEDTVKHICENYLR